MPGELAHDSLRRDVAAHEDRLRAGGSHFLGGLYKKWDNFTLLVPPSYNAGPAGVTRV